MCFSDSIRYGFIQCPTSVMHLLPSNLSSDKSEKWPYYQYKWFSTPFCRKSSATNNCVQVPARLCEGILLSNTVSTCWYVVRHGCSSQWQMKKGSCKSTYSMTIYTSNSRKCKLIYGDRKQISSCLGRMWGETRGKACKGCEESFGGNGYVRYLDRDAGFMGAHTCHST